MNPVFCEQQSRNNSRLLLSGLASPFPIRAWVVSLLEQGFLIRKTYNEPDISSEVRFGTTILQPPLLTYQALSVPTLIYFQT